jgi:hypothetical protein
MVFLNPRFLVGLRGLMLTQIVRTRICKPQVGGSIPLADPALLLENSSIAETGENGVGSEGIAMGRSPRADTQNQ